MKNYFKIFFCLSCILTIHCTLQSTNVYSQFVFYPLNDCPDIELEEYAYPGSGGLLKPERTDRSSGVTAPSTATFNILIVFVQFKNETGYSTEWPAGDSPVYKNDLLALFKDTIGDYWNRYDQNTETLSDWFQEVSMGTMHVTGKAYSVILDSSDAYYDRVGITVMNNEIYDKLRGLGTIVWPDYDLWSVDSLGRYSYARDGYIDMIFKVHRTKGNTINLFDGSGGFAYLKGEIYKIPLGVNDTMRIHPNHDRHGSGITIFSSAQAPVVTKLFAFNVARHEYGHYLLGPHRNCGLMGQGDGFLNPWESAMLGYMSPRIVNYDTVNYGLYDYSSRNKPGQILQVPVFDSAEFFLIVSRNKLSNHDVMLFGDTARGIQFSDVGDYGKGVYIYHVAEGGYQYDGTIDQECADGLYNFAQPGYYAPDWDPGNFWLPLLQKSSVSYNNEVSVVCEPNCPTNYYETDDRNVKGLTSTNGVANKWFSPGDNSGIDKLFTNDEEEWTSRSHWGDRYDPWLVGYNEVFSPYSSPSTRSWNDSNTGIYVWHYSSTAGGPSGLSYFKIYRTGAGGQSDSSILQLTPPSRPMGLIVMPCDSQPTINGYKRIKLRWNHNMEPDMRRSIGGEGLAKRYRIYRSTASDMGSVPPDALAYSENFYDCIDTVDINENSAAEYIDEELVSICNTEACAPPNYCIEYPVRYRVQAVDKYDDVSVLSDFANTRAGSLEAGMGGDNLLTGNDSELPKTYSLSQNYPNPFNPITNIRYDIPEDDFVTIKVFDVLGREVLSLVDEYKQAGRYLVSFNAANFSSGIYFYTINAGAFSQTRRMTVLK